MKMVLCNLTDMTGNRECVDKDTDALSTSTKLDNDLEWLDGGHVGDTERAMSNEGIIDIRTHAAVEW